MKPAVLCIGAAAVDRTFVLDSAPIAATSNPARACAVTFGGVARNVAENLARLGADVALLSAVGDDAEGRELLVHAFDANIGTQGVVADSRFATAQYVAVMEPSGDLAIGISSTRVIEAIDTQTLRMRIDEVSLRASYWFADCNLNAEALAGTIALAHECGARIAIDGVSVAKIRRLPARLEGIDVLFCNNDEAVSYLGEERRDADAAQGLHALGAAHAVVTAGARGAFAAGASSSTVPAISAKLVNATGAGDAFIAAALYALADGQGLVDALRLGAVAAAYAVESTQSVRSDLTLCGLQKRLSAENK